MGKTCRTCRYKSKSIAQKPCNSCDAIAKPIGDNLELVLSKWKSDNKKSKK